jgi:hypothetical protein
MTDDIDKRARKLGASTLRYVSDIAANRRLKDNNDEDVAPRSGAAAMWRSGGAFPILIGFRDERDCMIRSTAEKHPC